LCVCLSVYFCFCTVLHFVFVCAFFAFFHFYIPCFSPYVFLYTESNEKTSATQ
jgi:hypothetical protein